MDQTAAVFISLKPVLILPAPLNSHPARTLPTSALDDVCKTTSDFIGIVASASVGKPGLSLANSQELRGSAKKE